MSRKRKALSLKEKLYVLAKVDENPQKKRVDLARELCLPVSTLNTIVGKREEIQKNIQVFGAGVKQTRGAQHGKMEEVLLAWFREVRRVKTEKKSKERVTVLLCCNADGTEKLKPTVIGKYWKPRCFSRNPRLPVIYKANKKAWMTGALFTELLTFLDARMRAANRRILLVLDNCAAHPVDTSWLQNVKVIFLPPNCTSHLQPLDAGIIRNMKFHFRSLLIRRFLAKIDRKDASLKVDLLDAIHFLAMSWDRVKPETIANCFKKCGFFCAPGDTEENGDDGAEIDIPDWGDLNVDASPEEFVSADDQLATCELRTVQDIIADVTAEEESDDDDNQDAGDCSSDRRPLNTDGALEALDGLRGFVASAELSEETATRFYEFQKSLLQDLEKQKVQRKVTDYFKVL
ncbi:tigger transposable element-derived protein 6-like [Dermacentor andersoni]|uniref:tigger transposable element-derived protein 6-like n=1 Tax=Dermacentor andersoni TaxID=34620 RepID=UPI003B3A4039